MSRFKFTILAYLVLSYLFIFAGYGESLSSHHLQQTNTSSIGDYIWHDLDGDGVQDFGETGLENIRVLLFDDLDNFIGIEYSNAHGFFEFSNVSTGTYRLKFPTIQGLSFTRKDNGSESNDSDVFSNGYTDYFFVAPNQSVRNMDAGYKGSLQVYLGTSLRTCEGNQVELNASVFYGKGPYSFQWNMGLGNGPSKIVEPTTTTIYSVTATDGWGTTASTMIIVRVKRGVGEESCHIIDDFTTSGTKDFIELEVTPADPGPKTIIETSSIGLLGDTREIVFEHVSGDQPANLMLDYTKGFFTNSNDVGTVSQSTLCYNDNNQGIAFDLGAFDYLKFSNIEVDQGGINMIVSVSDGTNEVSINRKLLGLGSATIFDDELPIEFIPGSDQLDMTNVHEVCFTFYTSAPSVDFSLESIAACKTTDCDLEMSPDQEICVGETVTLRAVAPCSDQIIYHWDNNLPNGGSHDVSPVQTTTYHVTATDQDGCMAMGEITITVNPLPSVSLGPDLELCEGEPFSITAVGSGGTPPYTYTWSEDIQGNEQKTGVAFESSDIYVTITDDKGCQNTDHMTMTVHENPTVRLRTTLADCGIPNGTATATAADGSPPYEYFWSNGETGSVITDLAPGLYTVTVTDENGCFVTEQAQVMERYCGMIGDHVWLDNNGNGLQDDGENGIDGIDVVLFDEYLNPLDTATTLANGYYAFNNLAPASYHVQFVLPVGFVFTSPNQGIDTLDSDADTMTGISPLIEIDSMEQNLTIDAGMYQVASIGDQVWLDNNGNGIQDGAEAGIANATVLLWNCDQINFGQTTTDSDGFYHFENLKPGEYNLQFVLPTGKAFTLLQVGNDDSLDSDADPESGYTSCELLTSGENNQTYDAGMYEPASVGDFVWHDLDADGSQDTGEPGIPDVAVYLFDCAGNLIDTSITDPQGSYIFSGLIPAEYRIGLTLPDEYELSPFGLAEDEINSDIDPATNKTTCFNLVSGQADHDKDIGLFQRASIGDFVWEDINGNGIQDNGEPGLGQIHVELHDCLGNMLQSQTTSANGQYLFADLSPGMYNIYFDIPGGYEITGLQQGNNDQVDSDCDPQTGMTRCEVLVSSEDNLNFDAGLYQPASIGDLVWDDLNVDGIQDPGEPGVSEIKVILEDCNGIRLDSTITDPDGIYTFEDLKPGTYILNFGENNDTYFTAVNSGNDVQLDSDVAPFTGKTTCFLLESNAIDNSWDAGLAFTGDVGDLVWEDMNGNGIQDTGEPGFAMIPVRLYRMEGIMSYLFSETFTNVQGNYIFEDVPPGNYFVEFETPEDFDVTMPDMNQDLIDSDVTHANGTNTTDIFYVSPGMFKMDVDAGLYKCAEIGDLVWCDYTKNGFWDPSENGINGLEVRLYRQNASGQWVLWDITSTGWHAGSTCGDGYWNFCVIPGSYYIELNIPYQANLLTVEPNQGTNEEYDSDITHANGPETSDVFILQSRDIKTDLAGGYFYGAIIGDFIWEDQNGNGIQDTDEPGIEDILIELFDENGKIGETLSEYDGSYVFKHLLEGYYYLKFHTPEGMEPSSPEMGNDDTLDSDVTGANGAGTTDWIDLLIEEKNYTIDAGFHISTPFQVPENTESGFIYPNPTSGTLTISLMPSQSDSVSILINASNGEFIREIKAIPLEKNKRTKFPVDVKDLPNGHYSLRVLGDEISWQGFFNIVH